MADEKMGRPPIPSTSQALTRTGLRSGNRPVSSAVLVSQRSAAIDQIRKMARASADRPANATISDVETTLERLELQWEVERLTLEPVYDQTKLNLEAFMTCLANTNDTSSVSSADLFNFRASRELAKSRIIKASTWEYGDGMPLSEFDDRLRHLDEMWAAFYNAHDNGVAWADENTADAQAELDEVEELYFATKSRIRRLASATQPSGATGAYKQAQAVGSPLFANALMAPAPVAAAVIPLPVSSMPPPAVEVPPPAALVQPPVAPPAAIPIIAAAPVAPEVPINRPAVRTELKLPPVELPKFDGGFAEWTSFRDRFMCMIGNEATISDVHKLHFLKSCVGGEAARTIRAYPITERNFELAWTALVDRYDNTRLIVNTHLQALFDASSVRQDNSSSLRKLMDVFAENVSILAGLNEPVHEWSSILTFLLASKLDGETAMHWELSLGANSRPTFGDLQRFLEARCRSFDAAERNQRKPASAQSHQAKANPFTDAPRSFVVAQNVAACSMCSGRHQLYACQQFLGLSITERKAVVADKRLCFNCLSNTHQATTCPSSSCRTCQRRHHTLLHTDQLPSTVAGTSAHIGVTWSRRPTLLATALVSLVAGDGQEHLVRALIDPGSECSFVTENVVQRLRLRRTAAKVPITGINMSRGGSSSGLAHVTMKSRVKGPYQTEVEALVVKNITRSLPSSKLSDSILSKYADVLLADPDFNVPGEVDMLLGVEIYDDLLLEGEIMRDAAGPYARNTVLGWIVHGLCGEWDAVQQQVKACVTTSEHVNLEAQVRKFWEVEELPEINPPTDDETACEELFSQNTSRVKGRYMVRLPFRENANPLGQSRPAAVKSMMRLENRFRVDPALKEKYVTFMREYESLGHMERKAEHESDQNPAKHYYLPHLAVVTNKMRVVFDASRRTSSGVSLNHNLMVGARLQDDLFEIVMRFRCRKVALTSDITKMYRQILIHPDHRAYQRILWRENEVETLREYCLTTVTYGTSSAPFLAVRSLRQLAEDEKDAFPVASGVLNSDFYVDDLMTGCDSVHEAEVLQQQMSALLRCGGFELRKWASSHPDALRNVPTEHREELVQLEMGEAPFLKALGLYWIPGPDEFKFCVAATSDGDGVPTRRTVLSEVSKLFDPLGLLTPVIVVAKIFVQSLWAENLGWDNEIQGSLAEFWKVYKLELPSVQELRIPRWIGTISRTVADTEIHGFCDASEKAYCAALYVRIAAASGRPATVRLVVAKSRVAPTKPLTIPKLELCGAELLARLLKSFRKACGFGQSKCVLWTDSELVLWNLRAQPINLKTFTRHRVSKIQDAVPDVEWRHVPSGDNPADVGSRGVMPSKLKSQSIWWNGPNWLAMDSEKWPSPWVKAAPPEGAENMQSQTPVVAFLSQPCSENWLGKFSNLQKLIRVTATMIRFAARCRDKNRQAALPLSAEELSQSLAVCVRIAQAENFPDEIRCCKKQLNVAASSSLASLLPFVDDAGMLRVGGRLQNAAVNQDQMHQIILPPKCHLSRLIIRATHAEVLHGSVQLTMATLRQRFWMVGMRREVAGFIRTCIRCFKWRQRNRSEQVMGSLPKPRVTPNRAFLVTGVDFAGPIQIKSGTLRGSRTLKAYIAVFVCFATRAIHLELVSGLTSEAFLAALFRFISRRGRCLEMHSDCGTNFVGANAELKAWQGMVAQQIANADPARVMANEGIEWHFIPPGSPTFGGLWESAVKSTKHHLRRILTDTPLTFEAMATVLAQVEACLNSRPLCGMSDDPDDLAILTPGHFLIGEPMNSVPDPDLRAVPRNRLSHWQSVQQLVHHFWERWQAEYMSALQARMKWRQPQRDLAVGDLVLMVDERLPPTKWPLGRILQVFPGEDGRVRVAAVKSSKETVKRTIRKLCRLPQPDDDDQHILKAGSSGGENG